MDSRNVTRGSINFGVHSITVAADTLKLKRFSKGPDSIAMSVSLSRPDKLWSLMLLNAVHAGSLDLVLRVSCSRCSLRSRLSERLFDSDNFRCEDGLLYVVSHVVRRSLCSH